MASYLQVNKDVQKADELPSNYEEAILVIVDGPEEKAETYYINDKVYKD